MTYKASLDTFTKITTIGVTLLFAAIIIGQYPLIKYSGYAFPIFTTVLIVLTYFIAFAFRPIDYKILANELIIHRLAGNVKILRSQIKSVEVLDKKKIAWSVRTFGVGGLFGYYGKFANAKLGPMTWYATRRDRTVIIRTLNNKIIILTPDNPEEFVANFIM
jgi:hypothetical protein